MLRLLHYKIRGVWSICNNMKESTIHYVRRNSYVDYLDDDDAARHSLDDGKDRVRFPVRVRVSNMALPS